MQYNLSSSPSAGLPVVYGGFWRRFGAVFIDSLILLPASFMLGVAIGFTAVFWQAIFGINIEGLLSLVSFGAGIAFAWLYHALLESSETQATLGKQVFKLRVTNLQGERISFAQASGRFFGKYLSSLLLGIGHLMAAFMPKKQALHDLMAKTYVVRV